MREAYIWFLWLYFLCFTSTIVQSLEVTTDGNETYAEGFEALLTCEYTPTNALGVDITWMRFNTSNDIENLVVRSIVGDKYKSRMELEVSSNYQGKAGLRIFEVREEDAMFYHCSVWSTNEGGASEMTSLYVQYISSTLQPRTVSDSLHTGMPDLTTSSVITTSADSNIDVLCSDNFMTIYVPKSIVSNSTTPHLIDQSCVPYGYVTRKGLLWMYFMTQYDQCGTHLTSSIDDSTYHNEVTIQHAIDQASGTYHENSKKIAVRCCFENTAELSLSFIPREVVKVSSKESSGNLKFQLQLYTDEHFTQPIPTWSYPVTLDIGTRVYAGAKVETYSTEMTLFIDSCIATPTQEADTEPHFTLIDQRCSLDDPSLIFHSLGAVGESAKNVLFSFDTFGFVGYSTVFLHCDMSICNSTDWRCSSNCNQRIKRSADKTDLKLDTYPVMLGPIILKHDDDVSFGQIDKSTRKTSTGGSVMMLVGVLTCLVGCVSLARSIKKRKISFGYEPLIRGEQDI